MNHRARIHPALTAVLVLSMLFSPLTPLVQAQEGNPIWLPWIGKGTTANQLAATEILFRTQITVTSHSQWARLADLGVTVLQQTESGAVVLADYEQMTTLARLRFHPRNSEELGALVTAGAQDKPWVARSLRSLTAQAKQVRAEIGSPLALLTAEETVQQRGVDALSTLRSAVQALTPETRAAVASLPTVDDDGDGLTNTEEAWWCTDPQNANSDGDAQGYTDGQEVAALLDVTQPRNLRWGYGPPFGPPNAWPNFNNNDGTGVKVCNDGDRDTIPDYAEAYMVGTRPTHESTDNDKFDDGQELFGITYCPGGDTGCGEKGGTYPRSEYWNFIKASMPNWVLPPGDSPFVAAFPVPEVYVVPSSWVVERVTTITTTEGEIVQKTDTVETAVTRGQSTSIANTVTWNEWEEVSQAVEKPLVQMRTTLDGGLTVGIGLLIAGGSLIVGDIVNAGRSAAAAERQVEIADKQLYLQENDTTGKDTVQELQNIGKYTSQLADGVKTIDETLVIGFETTGHHLASIDSTLQTGLTNVSSSLDGVQYAIDRQGALLSRGLHNVAYAISQPRLTETRTSGKSWGGAQTTTHEVYEEHTISEGQAFTTGQNWSTAWAVNSSHAANLTFNYTVQNSGTEYARELSNLIFNIYLGDDKLPTISYEAWEQFTDGKLENLFPVGPNTPPGLAGSKTFASTPIPLSLEQMKRIDLGERLTVKVESYSYGADELFYNDAVNGGVTVFIEDGIEDGDESVDMYVIPTWGVESVEDVLTRYFPAGYDAEGNINALWTPEFSGVDAPTWREHFLSDIAWWNVYLTQPDAGDTALKDLPARAGFSILFRFNRDSDRDGYNDRAEFRYYCALPSNHAERIHCEDAHLRSEIHPQPELLAGYVLERNGDVVTAKLALENTGTFDAYGIDAVMYSPDETTIIGNNTVGGNGRVRPGSSVVVGSMIKQPSLKNWGSSTSKPYAAGQFSGTADLTFTFSAETPGVVGTGSTAIRWNDGAGNSAVLDLGSNYYAPLPLDVAHGVQVGFNTGTVTAGASFTITALTPRDTFTFTVNSEPFTPPVIVVSYSHPQGSTRFITPVELTQLGDSLAVHSGSMLEGLGLQIVSEDVLKVDGVNTTHLVVNSPHSSTIKDAHLHLNFVFDGKLVLEQSHTLDTLPGPTTFSAQWSVSDFSADYNPDGDNLLIAFWTDSENNIIDSTARPLPTFAVDPRPAADSDATDWGFGIVSQGEVLKRTVTLASVGELGLLGYVGDAPGLSVSQTGSKSLNLGDLTTYELALDTRTLPTGPYNETITLRTNDPQNPRYTLQVTGVIEPLTGDAYARPVVDRPLDVEVWVAGERTHDTWINFAYPLGPDPEGLHPLKLYNGANSVLLGLGRLATLPASCADVKEQYPYATDGIYTLHLGHTPNAPFQIFCRDMGSLPKEYLPLVNTGGAFNYSMVAAGGWWPGSDVHSRFQMIRIDPESLVVDRGDLTYAISTGRVTRTDGSGTSIDIVSNAYAVASTCKWTSDGLASANVDLRSTPFRLDDSVSFFLYGHLPGGSTNISSDRQVVNLTGGGACGDNAPSTPFVLKYISPVTPEGYTIEQTNPGEARLRLPIDITNGAVYNVQFGHKLDFAGPGGLTTLLRVPAGEWTSATLDALVSGVGTGEVTARIDVGNNGNWDWEATQTVTNAHAFEDIQLVDAFLPYVTGTGSRDVEVKVYLSKPGQLLLTNMVIQRNESVDVTPSFTLSGTPTEGAVVPLNVTLTNNGAADSGPLTVAFYATRNSQSAAPVYIGSKFVPSVSQDSPRQLTFNWNTLGFTGPVTVTASVDPYNRLAETDESNNTKTSNVTILTRPDLALTEVTLSDKEPLVGETVQVTAKLANSGQTAAPAHALTLYRDNPDGGGTLLQSQAVSTLSANAQRNVIFTWTPTTPGLHRLFLRSDRADQVNESDEGNNDRWLDVYVGMASPLAVDSGTAADTGYSPSQGFGIVDSGDPDEIGSCGEAAYQTFRRDPSGRVTYRFDHLQPGHFYHLDLVLYECGQKAGRQQRVSVDGFEIAGPVDLGSGEVETLSLLLDPALYADRSIEVTVSVDGTGGAIVNQIALVDVDYRYADAGGLDDVRYPSGSRPYGWLDGVRQIPWGTLPYQSLRENQSGSELRYRFDSLAADKEYQVHFGFYQGSGNNRVQQIWVDDIPLTGDFTLVAGQRNTQRIKLPKESYSDGTVTVAVRRSDGATTGAILNEIALEEITLGQAMNCQVATTPSFTIAYNTVTVSGQPAPAGTVVTAENPRGDVVGCFVVNNAGQYGFMNIYGEDTSSTPAIPGMRSGEPVIFRINGVMAVPSPLLIWQNDKKQNRVNLAAGVTEDHYLLLRPGWNLLSTRLSPPVPLIDIVFQSIAGKYCLVLGQRGIHDCTVPANFRSLKDIAPGQAYYTKIDGGASVNLVIEGVPLAAETPITLEKGLNWVGYLPKVKLPIATALQSAQGEVIQVADGQGRIYDPAEPGFSTLSEMTPGAGYLVHTNAAASLLYPSTGMADMGEIGTVDQVADVESVHCGGVEPTPHFTAIYGWLRVNGVDVAAGDRVEAVTPGGDVAGCFTVTTAGQYGFMPLFGAVDGDDTLPGFKAGDIIQLRLNGASILTDKPMTWADDKSTHRLDLYIDDADEATSGTRIYLPSLNR